MASAAETIIPVLSATLGVAFTWGSAAYWARPGGAYVMVRRMAPGSTVAAIEVDADSRSEATRIAIRIAEGLRAAGFEPRRDGDTVRVDWAVCALPAAA